MSPDFKILTWMVPSVGTSNFGFTTLVSPADGYYVIISEIRRPAAQNAFCFPCSVDGFPVGFSAIAFGADTPSALANLRDCWTPERHRLKR